MKVAVAIIIDKENRILITQRSHHTAHGGKWEFPGGKFEALEDAEQAIRREVYEELGLTVVTPQFIKLIEHQYDSQLIQLYFFLIKKYQGQPHCRESQLDLRWVAFSELRNFEFPTANQKMITMLPSLCAELGHHNLHDE